MISAFGSPLQARKEHQKQSMKRDLSGPVRVNVNYYLQGCYSSGQQ